MRSLLRNSTILVIDDDIQMVEMLRLTLEGHAAKVMVAHSVEEALELCRTSPPHVIVSDMRLGASDGFELIETLRKYNREYRGFTPAVALTGFNADGDEVRARAAGFNAYIRKPFDPVELLDTIEALIRDTTSLAA
jgi:CheY-like chemotaxis protein